jgi:AraC-like DNA-binding protein
MKEINMIKSLVGETVTAEDLRFVDSYVHNKMGLFIPSVGACEYARKLDHTHPSYMFVLYFFKESTKEKHRIELPDNNYLVTVTSPDTKHTEESERWQHYYCIMIEKEYFELQFKMYQKEIPPFNETPFPVCHDILKTLNMFAFECSKQMQNADVTLNAQMTILTHWLIRSILGENYDIRSISSNYSVARAQQYIEQHFGEKITVAMLAELGNVSSTTFNRLFKKEANVAPAEYIVMIRIEKAKKLLRRNDYSITEIALKCGFNSSAHFSSSFHSFTQKTPTGYRQLYQV